MVTRVRFDGQARRRRRLPARRPAAPHGRRRRGDPLRRRDQHPAAAPALRRRRRAAARAASASTSSTTSPGVGENLQDHLEVYIQYASKQPVSIAPGLKWRKRPGIGYQWLVHRRGLGATNHFEGGGFARSNEDVDYPNLMFHFLPVAIRYDGSVADRGPRLPGAHRPDVRRHPRLGADQEHRPEAAPVDAVQLPLDADRPARVGRGDPGGPRHPQPARLRAVQRRRALARPRGRDRRADPGLGARRRRDRAAPVVHRRDGRRRDVGRRPRLDAGARSRGPAGRRRVGLPVRHQRQHLRARDDGRREGGRPDRGQHAARRRRRALLPLPRRQPALPTRRPAQRPVEAPLEETA